MKATIQIAHLSILGICLATAKQPAFTPKRTSTRALLRQTDAHHYSSVASASCLASRLPAVPSIPRGGAAELEEDSPDDKEAENEPPEIINEEPENEVDKTDNNEVITIKDSLPKSSIRRSVSTLSTAILSKLYPCYLSIVLRMRRGIAAGWDAAWCNPDDDHENMNLDDNYGERDDHLPKLHSFLGKTGFVLQQVYRAALTGEDIVTELTMEQHSHEHGVIKNTKKRRRHHKSHKRRHKHSPTLVSNGGAIDSTDDTIQSLADKYNIETNQKHYSSILLSTHTTLQEALQKSNTNARFLICYISSSSSNNKLVIPTLLNPQFTKLLPKKPLGKKNLDNTGSYYIWICQDKPSAESATKRLKLSKSKSTSLTIIYPASTLDSSNKLKITPKILAQHHCNPPPSIEAMSAWITSIRKRHLREFAKLQHEYKERQLLHERSVGYERSIEEDRVREEREREELIRKQQEEEAELQRKKEMEQRRVELLNGLGEEPESGDNVVTIALRFQNVPSNNGEASTQRRFLKSDTMNSVFNWIDAVHGLERERVKLSTMNGGKSFVYVDNESSEGNVSLEEAGLGKMTALRVMEISDAESGAAHDDGSDE